MCNKRKKRSSCIRFETIKISSLFKRRINIWFTKNPFRSSHLYKYNNKNSNARYFCDFIILSDWKMSNYVRQKVLILFKMLNKQMYHFTKEKYFIYLFLLLFFLIYWWCDTMLWFDESFHRGPQTTPKKRHTRCAHITLHCTENLRQTRSISLSHINHNY